MTDTTLPRFERYVPWVGYMDLQPHGWIITKDHLVEDPEDRDDSGVSGPSELAELEWSELSEAVSMVRTKREIPAAWQAEMFSMYDDDGTRYYTGWIVWPANEEPDEETLVAPLDNFGTPNAGAVRITFRGHDEWEIG